MTAEPLRQPTTAEWAHSLGISTAPTPPTVDGYDEPCPFTARQIAIRAIILQGIVAVACDVDPAPVVDWYQEQCIWDEASPNERSFLSNPKSLSREQSNSLRWHQEAEWTLLWVAGKVEALGLPTRQCDTRRLADEIIPCSGRKLNRSSRQRT